MKGVRRFKDRLKKDLRDPEFRKAFDEEEVCVSLAIQIAKIRQERNITQQELARRLETSQQNISRLEHVDNRSYSLKTLIKVARVLDKRLKVELV